MLMMGMMILEDDYFIIPPGIIPPGFSQDLVTTEHILGQKVKTQVAGVEWDDLSTWTLQDVVNILGIPPDSARKLLVGVKRAESQTGLPTSPPPHQVAADPSELG